jgi:hypothetical protein
VVLRSRVFPRCRSYLAQFACTPFKCASKFSLQQDALNDRFRAMVETMNEAMASVKDGSALDPVVRESASAKLAYAFEPDADGSTVSVEDIAAHTGTEVDVVLKVVEQFRLDLGEMTPSGVVDAYMRGNNPMRTRPLVVLRNGRVMLPHNALHTDAVNVEGLQTSGPGVVGLRSERDVDVGHGHGEGATRGVLAMPGV